MSYDLLKTSKALGDETRLSIYRYLQDKKNVPASVQKLADHFMFHPNAIRQHLAKLEEAGLVFSEPVRVIGSGRPQRVYRSKGPLQGMELLPRDYKMLSEILLEFIGSSRFSIDEVKAFGRRWGEKKIRTEIGKAAISRAPHEIARLLVSQFSGWGFDPQLISTSDRHIDIRLQNCIFREVVEFHPDLVCPLLHGVLEGFLSPFMGQQKTALKNGIAHGQEFCQVLVSLNPLSQTPVPQGIVN